MYVYYQSDYIPSDCKWHGVVRHHASKIKEEKFRFIENKFKKKKQRNKQTNKY